MTRILIVEDEQHLADGLRFNLEADGFRVDIVDSGELALERILSNPNTYDLLVLDIMLPGRDGFSVMAELRSKGEFLPTLMLTARGRPEDVLSGFEAGADDYLPKPFELPILIARINSLLRRHQWNRRRAAVPSDVFEFSGKSIDFENLELRVGDKVLQLTLMEANLLRYLVDREGTAVSRRAMLEQVWGVRDDTDTRAIDNFIVRLRKYIEDAPSTPRHLLTVRGVGYKFVAEPARVPSAR
jgi:two-component system, OmpR family, alkaline phosphatase synthesis response regulator PhoP